MQKREVIIIVSIAIVLVIGAIVFLLLRNTSGISDTKLSEGAFVLLGENKEVKFSVDDEEHKISVYSVENDSVKITIQSSPVNVTFFVGETKKIDFDNNGTYDLSIKLNNITDGKADLYIKKISEIACEEDWSCSDWGECLNNIETRICSDGNNCSSGEGKPSEARECESLPACSALGGVLCTGTQTCNGTAIDALEENCCSGNCLAPAVDTTITSCGTNIDCMISAAHTCHLANMTYDFVTKNATWNQYNKHYYKIRELEGDDCVFYQEVLDVNGNYTTLARNALTAAGKTEEEINQLEQEIVGSLQIGETDICRYSVYSLEEFLLELKEKSIVFTGEDIQKFGCTE